MDFSNKKAVFISSIISVIIGAIIFICLFGYRVLNPFYVDWIFNINIDMRLYQIGWNYFQHSPWCFPIGLFDSLSYPVKMSILNTDSIPLFAIFFKLFKSILSDDFQYLGLYAIVCYMFQSFIGMVIIKRFTKNDLSGYIIAILSGALFSLMPVFVIRTLNQSVTAIHCLLLASFVPIIYNFNLKTKTAYFSVIGLISASINPYIVITVGLVFFIYTIYQYFSTKDIKEIIPLLLYSMSTIFVLYIIGAFTGTTEFVKFGYQEYGNKAFAAGFNLNGFFNSYNETRFFNLPCYKFQLEAYAYLGLGVIILTLIASCSFLFKYLKDQINFKIKETVFVLILISVSVILALSPTVTFGEKVLFVIPYPDFIINLWSVFYTTCRFIYITYYLIVILILNIIIKNFSQRSCLIILISCITLQIADIAFAPDFKNNFTRQRRIIKSKYFEANNDNLKRDWELVLSQNDIKYIFFDTSLRNIINLDYFEIDQITINRNKGVKFNDCYLARPIKYRDKAFIDAIKNPNKDAVFIFNILHSDENLITSSSLKYYYRLALEIILASSHELKGIEKYSVNINDVLEDMKRKD